MNWFVINIYKYCKYINIYIYGGIAPIVNIEKKKKIWKITNSFIKRFKELLQLYSITLSHSYYGRIGESQV